MKINRNYMPAKDDHVTSEKEMRRNERITRVGTYREIIPTCALALPVIAIVAVGAVGYFAYETLLDIVSPPKKRDG